MPTFDVVSEVDMQEVRNAVDQAKRELEKRYDLRGTNARFELDGSVITQFAPSEYQLEQLLDILRLRLAARGIDARCLDLGEVETNLAGSSLRYGQRSSRSTPRSRGTNSASTARSAMTCSSRSRCCARRTWSCRCSSKISVIDPRAARSAA